MKNQNLSKSKKRKELSGDEKGLNTGSRNIIV